MKFNKHGFIRADDGDYINKEFIERFCVYACKTGDGDLWLLGYEKNGELYELGSFSSCEDAQNALDDLMEE